MSGHTHKPWEYVYGAIVGPKLDDKETWLRPVVARFSTGVSLANLNLMLAAPELLEALKESHNALELFASDDSPCGQIAVAAVMEARSAIAKATGENT